MDVGYPSLFYYLIWNILGSELKGVAEGGGQCPLSGHAARKALSAGGCKRGEVLGLEPQRVKTLRIVSPGSGWKQIP
jgi:hypothetical protein